MAEIFWESITITFMLYWEIELSSNYAQQHTLRASWPFLLYKIQTSNMAESKARECFTL